MSIPENKRSPGEEVLNKLETSMFYAFDPRSYGTGFRFVRAKVTLLQ
ncbi:hypothetical protein SAMN04487894_106270 [Niabella drilacis]|uniref:Uncharacterized protein n=1 Tax=Niabella drilacis (strain DSM 25811 / CCM 8410 / CCUG 62505 / LMG 26954 / E90) TaxID=1285928 RepID=A0A1G6SMY3_NIADE|nr:hypothetical protein SAMN04487894_106270 [Niabella drilacis]